MREASQSQAKFKRTIITKKDIRGRITRSRGGKVGTPRALADRKSHQDRAVGTDLAKTHLFSEGGEGNFATPRLSEKGKKVSPGTSKNHARSRKIPGSNNGNEVFHRWGKRRRFQ